MCPKSKKLKQAFGNWVVGDQFWDRDDDIRLFIKKISQGAHLYMVAQRRMGKTSLLREAARRLEKEYICLFVDFQKSKDPQDAVTELSLVLQPHEPLWNKTKKLFSNILERIETVGAGDYAVTLRSGINKGNWTEKGDQILGILANAGKPVLLLLDEVPILVNRILKGDDLKITPERRSQADEWMSWLRQNSIKHKGKIHFVVTGSIGFEPVLHQAKLSATINNFVPFKLDPWPSETSAGCLHALANEYGIQLEEGAAEEIVNRLGCCIPHHVQMFFSHIYDRCARRKNMKFLKKEVKDIYQNEMLGTRGLAELTHYEERLRSVLDKEYFTLAVDMLSEAAVTGKLSKEALTALQKEFPFPEKSTLEVQQDILQVLEHDGYLERKPRGYVFISKLLRDWWRRRYEQFFTPVLERKG